MPNRSFDNQLALVVHNDVDATKSTGSSYSPRQFEIREKLIMLVPRTEEAASRIFHTSVIECNKSHNHTPYQCAAFYFSALSVVFPGLLPLAKEALEDIGYTVKEVTEDKAVKNKIRLESWINRSTLFGVFGQLVLILFNNTDNLYDKVLKSRVSAIKHAAGMVGYLVSRTGDNLLSDLTASDIRTIVGSSSKFCDALLNMISLNQYDEGRFGGVCKYLAGLDLKPQTFT